MDVNEELKKKNNLGRWSGGGGGVGLGGGVRVDVI